MLLRWGAIGKSWSVELIEDGEVGSEYFSWEELVSISENGIGEVVRVRRLTASGITDACLGFPVWVK